MKYMAKYEDTCGNCGNEIIPDVHSIHKNGHGWVHDVCPQASVRPAVPDLALRQAEELLIDNRLALALDKLTPQIRLYVDDRIKEVVRRIAVVEDQLLRAMAAKSKARSKTGVHKYESEVAALLIAYPCSSLTEIWSRANLDGLDISLSTVCRIRQKYQGRCQ